LGRKGGTGHGFKKGMCRGETSIGEETVAIRGEYERIRAMEDGPVLSVGKVTG